MGKGSVTSTSATSEPVPPVKKDDQFKADDRKHRRLPKPSFPKPSFPVSTVNEQASAATPAPPAQPTMNNATSRTSTAKTIALPANCADAQFIYNLMEAAAAAASRAAAEAVTGVFSKAYNIPLTTETTTAEQAPASSAAAEMVTGAYIPWTTVSTTAEQDLLEVPLKDCTMNENWNCGNKALQGEEGWIHTKSGGWRHVCKECKQHLAHQQKISERTGMTPIVS